MGLPVLLSLAGVSARIRLIIRGILISLAAVAGAAAAGPSLGPSYFSLLLPSGVEPVGLWLGLFLCLPTPARLPRGALSSLEDGTSQAGGSGWEVGGWTYLRIM